MLVERYRLLDVQRMCAAVAATVTIHNSIYGGADCSSLLHLLSPT